VAGEDIRLLDPSPAVAQQLKRQLQHHHSLASESQQGSLHFWSSGDLHRASHLIARLLDKETSHSVAVKSLPECFFHPE
jgi:glutamate racemase